MSSVTTTEYCEPCMFVKLESVKADMFCEDCRERYCGYCALDHAKFRVFRNHHIVDVLQEYENMKIGPTVQVAHVDSSEVNSMQKVPRARVYSNEDRAATNTVNDAEDTKKDVTDGHKPSPQANGKEGTSFNVKVAATDLAKRIPKVSKDNLSGTIFKLTVCKTELRLLLGDKIVFQAGMHTIRRYGLKDNCIGFEFGRACELGAGHLKIICPEASAIMKLVGERTESKY